MDYLDLGHRLFYFVLSNIRSNNSAPCLSVYMKKGYGANHTLLW